MKTKVVSADSSHEAAWLENCYGRDARFTEGHAKP
jgi:hypothetical protein